MMIGTGLLAISIAWTGAVEGSAVAAPPPRRLGDMTAAHPLATADASAVAPTRRRATSRGYVVQTLHEDSGPRHATVERAHASQLRGFELDRQALLQAHWGTETSIPQASSGETLWMVLAVLVILASGTGLLLILRRMGVGLGPALATHPELSLTATLSLRPGMTLHLVRTAASDVLVAVDQRGINALTVLASRFELPEEGPDTEAPAADFEAVASRRLATSPPLTLSSAMPSP